MRNLLFYGDNLQVLREHIKDESVDLIYLDPPFKSGKDYNILFQEANGSESKAQIKAFEDTWTWDQTAAETYDQILLGKTYPHKVKDLIKAFRDFLGPSEMMAYVVMMAIRLVELQRVLRGTGSIYLHCDSTASHYLKLLMDAIFGGKNFQNELIWCYEGRELSHKRWNRKHDVILFYTKRDKWNFYWEPVVLPLKETSKKALSQYVDDNGRPFILRYKKGGGFAPQLPYRKGNFFSLLEL